MPFNAIDVLLVVLVLLSVLKGWRRGFIHGVLDLGGWALSLVAGLSYYQPVAHWLGRHINVWSEVWDQPIAFVLVAIFVGVAVHLVGYALLRRLPKDVHERTLNQVLGFVPGLGNGLITAAIVSALLLSIPLSEDLRERARVSATVSRLAGYAERL